MAGSKRVPIRARLRVALARQAEPGQAFTERYGACVLFFGAIAAWVIAVWQADHEAVATVFAGSGFGCLVAAAYYSRVITVGTSGVGLAREKAEESAKSDDTPAEVINRFLMEAERLQVAPPVQGRRRPDAYELRSSRTREQLERIDALMLAVLQGWLNNLGATAQDAEIHPELPKDQLRTDLEATVRDTRWFLELRPAIDKLREADAQRISERLSSLRERHHYRSVRLVLRSDASVEPAAFKHLVERSIGLVTVDLNTHTVTELT